MCCSGPGNEYEYRLEKKITINNNYSYKTMSFSSSITMGELKNN